MPHTHVSTTSFWHYLIVIPMVVILRIWLFTISMRFDEHTRELCTSKSRMIVLIWHNMIFITPLLKLRFRKNEPMAGLVSPSKDGALLSAVFKFFGVTTVRGSSKRRGAFAIKDMVNAVCEGSDMCITPDGPRGPIYKIKPGALKLAELTGAKMLILRAKYSHFVTFNSWDKFMLPLPFSRVDLKAVELSDFKTLSQEAQMRGITLENYVENLLG